MHRDLGECPGKGGIADLVYGQRSQAATHRRIDRSWKGLFLHRQSYRAHDIIADIRKT